jgi:hypothetical protein
VIHHISIPARDPEHVARVLVELFDGRLTGFGPYPGSFIAWACDDVGAAIEVYPAGTEMVPPDGPGQATFRHDPNASRYVATHATVSVQRSVDEVLALGEREGWRAVRLSRGPHDVIELWVENSVMLEIMTPEMTADYLASVPRR